MRLRTPGLPARPPAEPAVSGWSSGTHGAIGNRRPRRSENAAPVFDLHSVPAGLIALHRETSYRRKRYCLFIRTREWETYRFSAGCLIPSPSLLLLLLRLPSGRGFYNYYIGQYGTVMAERTNRFAHQPDVFRSLCFRRVRFRTGCRFHSMKIVSFRVVLCKRCRTFRKHCHLGIGGFRDGATVNTKRGWSLGGLQLGYCVIERKSPFLFWFEMFGLLGRTRWFLVGTFKRLSAFNFGSSPRWQTLSKPCVKLRKTFFFFIYIRWIGWRVVEWYVLNPD